MQWGRIDLDQDTLRIDRTKTPTGRRTLQLSGAAKAVLQDARRLAELKARDPRAYVFPGLSTSPHVHERQLIEKMVELCEANDVYVYPGDEARRVPHPHELRHTFASHMLTDGAVPQRVAAILGDKGRNGPPGLRT